MRRGGMWGEVERRSLKGTGGRRLVQQWKRESLPPSKSMIRKATSQQSNVHTSLTSSPPHNRSIAFSSVDLLLSRCRGSSGLTALIYCGKHLHGRPGDACLEDVPLQAQDVG